MKAGSNQPPRDRRMEQYRRFKSNWNGLLIEVWLLPKKIQKGLESRAGHGIV
jgi:hypothetical protein